MDNTTMNYAAFAVEQKPQGAITLSELAPEWQIRFKNRGLSERHALLELQSIIQKRVTRLTNEKCEELSEAFHPILREGAQDISASLVDHPQLLNEMLRSFLQNQHKNVSIFETDTLYGKVFITIKDGIPGGWRKERLQILIDLPQINEKGKQELPPLGSEVITSDKINPSWYLCSSRHGMIKFGCDGKPQQADGARLTLWCGREKLIVGTLYYSQK